MIQINYHDSRPIYEKVKDSLRQLIFSGALGEGEKLPSVRELEQEGAIVSVPGKGSFVALGGSAKAARMRELKEKLNDLAAQFEALGISRDELARIIKEDSHD